MIKPAIKRRGFTLIELGASIAIMGLLASAVLFAMYHVQEDAKVQRTKTQITKINDLILPLYNSYRTRAVPMRVPRGLSGREVARVRLFAMREMMRMDIPDRITDVLTPPINFRYPLGGNAFFDFTVRKTSRRRAYERIVLQRTNGNPANWTPEHQGAECLYMILSRTREAGDTGLDSFRESEIADLDEDGMPEIVDGWGNPIEFLRWAPGFTARVGRDGEWGEAGTDDDNDNIDDNVTEAGWETTDDLPTLSDIQDIRKQEPDPFDPFKVGLRWPDTQNPIWNDTSNMPERVNNNPYALFPLIISAGPDQVHGIRFDLEGAVMNYALVQNPMSQMRVSVNGSVINNAYPNDPYFRQAITGAGPFQAEIDPNGVQLGQPIPTFEERGAYLDNVHNHALGAEVGE